MTANQITQIKESAAKEGGTNTETYRMIDKAISELTQELTQTKEGRQVLNDIATKTMQAGAMRQGGKC